MNVIATVASGIPSQELTPVETARSDSNSAAVVGRVAAAAAAVVVAAAN